MKEEALESSRLCSLSLHKIEQAMLRFCEEKVDIVICMGDLVDVGENIEESRACLNEVIDLISSFSLPFLFVTGNHDFKVYSPIEWKKQVKLILPPRVYDTEEYTFICLDPNYRSDGSHCDPTGSDWRDVNLPEEQLQFLKNTLKSSSKPCVVALHEPLDSFVEDCYRVNNAGAVRNILKEESDKVALVLQGHMHEYRDYTEEGIRYLTVTGMCEGESNRYMLLTLNDTETEITVIEQKS